MYHFATEGADEKERSKLDAALRGPVSVDDQAERLATLAAMGGEIV